MNIFSVLNRINSDISRLQRKLQHLARAQDRVGELVAARTAAAFVTERILDLIDYEKANPDQPPAAWADREVAPDDNGLTDRVNRILALTDRSGGVDVQGGRFENVGKSPIAAAREALAGARPKKTNGRGTLTSPAKHRDEVAIRIGEPTTADLVLEILRKAPQSSPELLPMLQQVRPGIPIASVYTVCSQLKQKKLIKSMVDDRDGQRRYFIV